MATILRHAATGQTLRAGRGWKDENGVQHPSNWNIWSVEEKTAAGVTEIVQESPPDSRLYTWSHNADGTVNSTAKSLTDIPLTDGTGEAIIGKDGNPELDINGQPRFDGTGDPILDGNGNERMFPGVKSTLKEEVNNQQGSLLDQTDWYIVRKADKGTAIPSNVQTWRDAIRTKGDAMVSAIDGAANTDAVAALFVVYESDGKTIKSGILYDWPTLDE
jgi:hypothetical protein